MSGIKKKMTSSEAVGSKKGNEGDGGKWFMEKPTTLAKRGRGVKREKTSKKTGSVQMRILLRGEGLRRGSGRKPFR